MDCKLGVLIWTCCEVRLGFGATDMTKEEIKKLIDSAWGPDCQPTPACDSLAPDRSSSWVLDLLSSSLFLCLFIWSVKSDFEKVLIGVQEVQSMCRTRVNGYFWPLAQDRRLYYRSEELNDKLFIQYKAGSLR